MSKLTHILEDQLDEARREAGRKIVRKLKNGLRIEMTALNGVIYLTLTRDNQYPSLQEWETVIRHFPYYVPKTAPLSEQTGSRFTMFNRLPSENTLKLL